MLPKPHTARDSFFHETSPSPSSSPPITIYFITGNPGIISYYHAFLSSLSQKISGCPGSSSGSEEKQTFHIFGHSLAGFEAASSNFTPEKDEKERYYDLEEQICFVQGRLQTHMRCLRDEYAHNYPEVDIPTKRKVILMGHSVGTYMAMEVLRRHREKQAQSQSHSQGFDGNDFDIIGGVLLFPTVMDIAKSPSGQKLTFLLRIIPQLSLVVSLFARFLILVLPTSILRSIIRSVMRSPPETAVDATCSFLQSKRGVRQALHMAADEMRTITSDKWSDDVWGVSSANGSPTRLFFYFGRNDHWVAEQTREDLVALRGRTKMGPRMIVCEESVPHAFCLKHSESMSSKVADMVQKILEG